MSSADALIAAARKTTRTFAWIARIGHPSLQRARDAVAAGELGDIVNVHAHFLVTYGNGEKWDDEERTFFDPVANGGRRTPEFRALSPLGHIRRHRTGRHCRALRHRRVLQPRPSRARP